MNINVNINVNINNTTNKQTNKQGCRAALTPVRLVSLPFEASAITR